jgi:uncharacterized DUF497 family protein
MQFEWDGEKARENQRKHRFSFEEAAAVFDDPLSVTFLDPDHSVGEQRYLEIGHSARGRLLVVSYVERQGRIRIISCRQATRRERMDYEKS